MTAKLWGAAAIWWALASAAFPQSPEVALAIVYDTSGSMRDAVRDVGGRGAPKYVIGNRALLAVIGRLESFRGEEPAGAAVRLETGLFTFDGKQARAAVRLGKFDARELRHWAKSFIAPDGPTPLGPAVQMAADALLERKAGRSHVLVITDGENTAGPDPATVIRALNQQASPSGEKISFHFVAFDVNANAFKAIKEQGATVVSAADEKELNDQLEFILEEKILLEK